MAALRFPRVWWTLGWLLVIAVCVASLVPGEALPLENYNDKVLHATTYCGLMLWFSGLFVRVRALLAVAAMVFLLGVLLDVAQGVATPYRTFDVFDIAANGGGILLGLVLARLVFAGWCERIERILPV